MRDNKLMGALGEELARGMLYADGYRIVEHNYRTHVGEVDIICEKDGVYFFVEVKTRRGSSFGDPYEAVDERKKMKIRRTAALYMQSRHIRKNACFKVIEVMIRETDDDFI